MENQSSGVKIQHLIGATFTIVFSIICAVIIFYAQVQSNTLRIEKLEKASEATSKTFERYGVQILNDVTSIKKDIENIKQDQSEMKEDLKLKKNK